MAPIIISKGEMETCMIEPSINSVRISIMIKKGLEIEHLLTRMLERFMSLRADKFDILRKKPAHKDFDFSLLISADHMQKFTKAELINFVLEFVQGIEKEISEMKLGVINHARISAGFFVHGLAGHAI